MSGNVWEWTDSWYDNSKQTRVLRGGSWISYAYYLRASYRNYYAPDDRYAIFGFRCSQY
jgi:formylglycine-generating enzyme required for sulfatase activity